jgi:hypothetical protein
MGSNRNFFEKVITYLTNLTNKEKLMLFVTLYGIVYILSFNGESKDTSSFFIITFVVIGFMIKTMSNADIKKTNDDITKYMRDLEVEVVNHCTPMMVLEAVYKIHKPLKSLRFVRNNEDASNIIYSLRFLKLYDKEMYLDFIIYFEYFLKIHFNVMIGKYDITTNYAILQDIRQELLNTLQSYHFNIPNYSTTFDNGDLDEKIRIAILKMQALTYKYKKIIHKKYRKKLLHVNYKGEEAFDKLKDNHFHIY